MGKCLPMSAGSLDRQLKSWHNIFTFIIKRIFTYNIESNSLMVESLENCYEITSEMVGKDYGTVQFYDKNKELIMSFVCVSNPEELTKKAIKARDEIKK